jgi:putative ABC transport system permease protein
MNAITRGVRNALRSPVRSGAIMLMLAISMGLILAMLVARTSVNAKIAEVKATTATQITINPAGVQGGLGGGDPLTKSQVDTIKNTAHVRSITSVLMDQLAESNTSLKPSFDLGKIGERMTRFDSSVAPPPSDDSAPPEKGPTPRTTVRGTSDPESVIKSSQLTSGSMIDGGSSDYVALVGKSLAEKNKLSVGDTFTMYGKKITVKGIFSADSEFENNGLIMPVAAVQKLTDQEGQVTNVTATADSSDNVASIVSALKKSLGNKADITSQQEEAENSVKPLQGIATLATAGVIAAALAGAVIILLSMIMVVRERRREIGVIKAIGGTNVKVITQFIAEALTLTIIGAILGLGIGTAASGPLTQSLVSSSSEQKDGGTGGAPMMMGGNSTHAPARMDTQLRNSLSTVTSTLTPQVFASSIGIILLIAIVGSAVPAWAIARVRPAEVLRTE